MNMKAVISCVLMMVGMLICIGAVGTLDFLGTEFTGSDIIRALIQGGIGIIFILAAAVAGKDVEFKEE